LHKGGVNMLPHFIWNNTSSEDLEIVVNKLPPIQTASQKGKFEEVDGRDGYLYNDDESLAPIDKEILITLKDLTKLNYIKAWLRGEGILKLSSEPGVFYKGRIYGQVDWPRWLLLRQGTIKIKCQPLNYLDEGLDMITLLGSSTLSNPGTASANPIIKVYGTGEITLTINNDNYILKNVSEYVTINADIRECYKDLTPKNNDVAANEWPKLVTGDNVISWVGTVTKVEIIPNWGNC